MSDLSILKQEVLYAAKHAFDIRLVAATNGNVSAVDRESGRIVITPAAYDYERMTEDDIVVIDFDGKKLEGELEPSSEWKMHSVIYQRVERVGAVVHTHSPYATSFAVNNQEIPVVLTEMAPFLNGAIEVAPYAIQGSLQLGLNSVPILKGKNAALLANHGVVAVGATVQEAYDNSIYVEDAAKIYHMALCVGDPVVLEKYREE